MFRFREFYFLFVSLFDWGYARTQFLSVSGIGTVSHWQDSEMENLLPTLTSLLDGNI